MPYAKKEDKAAQMQDYRKRQTDLKEDEESLRTLHLLEVIQCTEKNENELEKMKADPAYMPPLDASEELKFQPLPEHLLHLLNPYEGNQELSNYFHSRLSHFYYEMSRAERSEAALRATVQIEERRADALSKNLRAAQDALLLMQFKKGIGCGSSEKTEDFEVRLERFAWCAKQLKEQGFGWYVVSEACGKAYLLPSDFMTYEELMGIVSSGPERYVPSNKFWNLSGKFRKRPFVETHGDLDWMREWALSEREECIASEEKDRQDYKNMYDKMRVVEKVQLKAHVLFTGEKLSEEQVCEKLKSEKNPILDDMELKAFIGLVKGEIEKEERDAIFQEKADIAFTEPITESVHKITFTPVKEKIKTTPKVEVGENTK